MDPGHFGDFDATPIGEKAKLTRDTFPAMLRAYDKYCAEQDAKLLQTGFNDVNPDRSRPDSGHRRYDEPLDQNVGFSSVRGPDVKLKTDERLKLGPSDNNMEKYAQAVHFAKYVHMGQTRKYNGLPYVTHPMRCGDRALDLFKDVDMGIAMLLHDGPEDQIERCPFILIEALYGPRVMNLVLSLTNPSKKHPEKNREERKALDREHYAKAYIYTKCLKLIDRIDNLKELDVVADPGFAILYCGESALLLDAIEATTPYASTSPFGVLANEMKDTISGIRNRMGVKP